MSADTVVPNPSNPQTLNRFSYVNNGPLIYIDPSGHCINKDGDQTRDDLFDCSIDELDALPFEIRASWLAKLAERGGVPDMFDNIQAILRAFAGNPFLKNDAYVSASDAALLWVIQEGFRLNYRSGGNWETATNEVRGWGIFFMMAKASLQDPSSIPAGMDRKRWLTSLWGKAERAGTAYGLNYAKNTKYLAEPSGEFAGPIWHNFISIGDAYRNWQSDGDSQAGLMSTPYNALYMVWGSPNDKIFGVISPVWFGFQLAAIKGFYDCHNLYGAVYCSCR